MFVPLRSGRQKARHGDRGCYFALLVRVGVSPAAVVMTPQIHKRKNAILIEAAKDIEHIPKITRLIILLTG